MHGVDGGVGAVALGLGREGKDDEPRYQPPEHHDQGDCPPPRIMRRAGQVALPCWGGDFVTGQEPQEEVGGQAERLIEHHRAQPSDDPDDRGEHEPLGHVRHGVDPARHRAAEAAPTGAPRGQMTPPPPKVGRSQGPSGHWLMPPASCGAGLGKGAPALAQENPRPNASAPDRPLRLAAGVRGTRRTILQHRVLNACPGGSMQVQVAEPEDCRETGRTGRPRSGPHSPRR